MARWTPSLVAAAVAVAGLAGLSGVGPTARPVPGPWFSCVLTSDVYRYLRERPVPARLLMERADLISVGDSRVMATPAPHVLADRLGVRAFVHARPLGWGGNLARLLDEVERLPPRKLIIGISPGALAGRVRQPHPVRQGDNDWTMSRLVFERCVNLGAERLISRAVPTASLVDGFERDHEATYFQPLTQWSSLYVDRYDPHHNDQFTHWLLVEGRAAREPAMADLSERLKRLREAGWSVVCVRLPISRSLLAVEEKHIPSERLAEMVRRAGVPYLDYSTLSEAYPTHDGSHLTGPVSEAFTRRLADDLRERAGW